MEKIIFSETTLRDYLRIIFRHKILFVIFPLVIIFPAYVSLEMQTPTYEATVKMNVKARTEIDSEFYKVRHSPTLIEDHTEFVKSITVLKRVVNALKLYEIPLDYESQYSSRLKAKLIHINTMKLKESLLNMSDEKRQTMLVKSAVNRLNANIRSVPVQTLSFFTIQVRDFDPNLAVVIANSVARSYIIFDIELQIAELKLQYGEQHSKITKLMNYIEEVKPTLDGRLLPAIDAMGPASIKIVQQAESAGEVSLNKRFMLLISFAASLVFSVIGAFFIEFFDQTFKNPEDIEKYLEIPFLGSLPKIKSGDKLIIRDVNPPNLHYISCYQILSKQMSLVLRHKNLKSILITDFEGSGSIYNIAANIGKYLADKTGYNVIIIDADLRDSGLFKIFGIPNSPGLAEVLEKKSLFIDAVQSQGANMHILPSGKTALNPITLLDSNGMSEVISRAKEQYDLIFVICPDLKHYMDASVLSTFLDGTVLVINEGKIRRQIVENSINVLKEKKINIIGAILNNREYAIPQIIYKLT